MRTIGYFREREFGEKFFVSLFVIFLSVLVAIIEGDQLEEIYDQSRTLFFSGLGAACISFFTYGAVREYDEQEMRDFLKTIVYGVLIFFGCLITILALPRIDTLLSAGSPHSTLGVLVTVVRNTLGVVCLLTGLAIARALNA